MIGHRIFPVFLTCCLLLAGASSAAGEEAAPRYSVKPSDVAVPADVPLGQYRRSTQPFENWILICDENLKAKTRVCNVSQTLVDSQGTLVFSWSMAATQKGQPFMIMRTAPDARIEAGMSLTFPDIKEPLPVAFQGCTATVCLGQVSIGPLLKAQIGKGVPATVSYQTKAGRTVTVTAPLKGLREAVSSIKCPPPPGLRPGGRPGLRLHRSLTPDIRIPRASNGGRKRKYPAFHHVGRLAAFDAFARN